MELDRQRIKKKVEAMAGKTRTARKMKPKIDRRFLGGLVSLSKEFKNPKFLNQLKDNTRIKKTSKKVLPSNRIFHLPKSIPPRIHLRHKPRGSIYQDQGNFYGWTKDPSGHSWDQD